MDKEWFFSFSSLPLFLSTFLWGFCTIFGKKKINKNKYFIYIWEKGLIFIIGKYTEMCVTPPGNWHTLLLAMTYVLMEKMCFWYIWKANWPMGNLYSFLPSGQSIQVNFIRDNLSCVSTCIERGITSGTKSIGFFPFNLFIYCYICQCLFFILLYIFYLIFCFFTHSLYKYTHHVQTLVSRE